MLVFFIGSERYATSVQHILEIIPKVPLEKITNAPEYAAGLLDFRGVPVPVVDLSWLVYGTSGESCYHTRIVIVQSLDNKHVLGLVAEKVTGTVQYEISDFADSGIRIEHLPFIDGIYSDETGIIRYFLVEKLFQEVQDKLFFNSSVLEK